MPYTTIITEGGLLPPDILDAIASGELEGQRPEDFGLERGRNLSDRIAAAWQAARGHWMLFKTYVEDLREGDPATSVTRQRWVLPLLDLLGYQLAFNAGAYTVAGRTYAISHRAGQPDDALPIHIEGIRTSLDARPPSGRPRLSPHALLQEYLNNTEQLWGIVANGERLRLLRDSSRFTRPAYVEFDLRAMFEDEKFSEFALLYRLLHRSRLPRDGTDAPGCLLEKYHQQAVETGGRVREKLRDGVETALKTLGNGLLEHPANAALRARLVAGKLTPLAYYRQLLRLVYRLLFLMVAEERGLIAADKRHDESVKEKGERQKEKGESVKEKGERQKEKGERQKAEDESVKAKGERQKEKGERQKAEDESVKDEDEDEDETLLPFSFKLLPSSFIPSSFEPLNIYRDHYSIGRLRRLAEQPGAGRGPYDDLWMGLQTTFRLLEGSDEQSPRSLGLAPLDGDLFGPDAIADLEGQRLRNADLLRAIRALSLYHEKESRALRRVNYGALDVEELGSVYESLLDYRPIIESKKVKGEREKAKGEREKAKGEREKAKGEREKAKGEREKDEERQDERQKGEGEREKDAGADTSDDGDDTFTFYLLTFTLVAGTERKTTGSYYTRPELVQELIKSALEPVIEARLANADKMTRWPDGHITATASNDSWSSGHPVILSPQEQALLSIRVCDPACGSGHFLLAAARRIGRELAKVRSGEEQPTPAQFRRAVRDVIQHCIYGVDLNPLAVDLCKLALWIEGHNAGMPLNFLDHHIKQGNSLIGATRALVQQGIPDEAYKPVSGDDKKVAAELRKRNRAERERYLRGYDQPSLFEAPSSDGNAALADALRQLDEMAAGSVAEVRAKAARYRQVRAEAEDEFTRFNLWTAAFFQPLTPENAPRVPTTGTLADFERNPRAVRADIIGAANGMAVEAGFFHWELEFPHIFEGEREKAKGEREKAKGEREKAKGEREKAKGEREKAKGESTKAKDESTKAKDERQKGEAGEEEETLLPFSFNLLPFSFNLLPSEGGFDVVLGNPPWERIKLQEQEHWVDVPEVRDAPNKAAREKLIQAWRASDDPLKYARVALFDTAKYRAEAESRFVRASGRFPLTAVGDVNTYALFAEHARTLLAPIGRAGIIVPTGIATDDTTKAFFGDLSRRRNLVSLYDFENRDAIFPGVHRSYKFSLLTIGETRKPTRFVFFATATRHIHDEQRVFTLTPEEIALINPNTRTAPVFRTQADAELTRKIYQRVPVLVDEAPDLSGSRATPIDPASASQRRPDRPHNPWGVSFMRIFDMSNDSHLFHSAPGEGLLPLYEAKLLHQFTHRWATYEKEKGKREKAQDNASVEARELSAAGLADPRVTVTPRYWVRREEVDARLAGRWERGWLLGFRDIARATDERTAIFSLLPRVGVGHKAPLLFASTNINLIVSLLACLNSLVFDFIARQKVGGTSLSFFILKQLPVLPPSAFSAEDIAYIVPRVLELVYTAWDMRAFAEDVWEEVKSEKEKGESEKEKGESEKEKGESEKEKGEGGAVMLAEILRRNAECNGDAPRDLFPATPGVRADGSVDLSLLPSTFCLLPSTLLPSTFCLPPFRWNDERRALIRAELDARIARLYGLTRDELRYILDPQDVYGPDFPGETFRVLKEKEIKQFGEYRTRRLVLEAWEKEEGR